MFSTKFSEYVQKVKKVNLHPKQQALYATIPGNLLRLPHLLFYGSRGIGKYSQALLVISTFSPSQLKVEYRIPVISEKDTHYLRASDIHFEVDMALLGCNAKILWDDIYNHILDIVRAKNIRQGGIVLCKNMHMIHNELLDIFYSYMKYSKHLKFILLTEHLSFLPDNIQENCGFVPFAKPSKRALQQAGILPPAYTLPKEMEMDSSSRGVGSANPPSFLAWRNLQLLQVFQGQVHPFMVESHCLPCQKTWHLMDGFMTLPTHSSSNFENHNCRKLSFAIDVAKWRDSIYNLFIYRLDIYLCIEWFFRTALFECTTGNKNLLFSRQQEEKEENKEEEREEEDKKKDDYVCRCYEKMLLSTFQVYKRFNNNYRPLFHFEKWLIELKGMVIHMQSLPHPLPPGSNEGEVNPWLSTVGLNGPLAIQTSGVDKPPLPPPPLAPFALPSSSSGNAKRGGGGGKRRPPPSPSSSSHPPLSSKVPPQHPTKKRSRPFPSPIPDSSSSSSSIPVDVPIPLM